MNERAGIIKALEICATGTSPCSGCPMKGRCKGTSNAAMAAAVSLLRKDELELNSLADNLNEMAEFNRKLLKKITTKAVKCNG